MKTLASLLLFSASAATAMAAAPDPAKTRA
jgi:hypothetical protein